MGLEGAFLDSEVALLHSLPKSGGVMAPYGPSGPAGPSGSYVPACKQLWS